MSYQKCIGCSLNSHSHIKSKTCFDLFSMALAKQVTGYEKSGLYHVLRLLVSRSTETRVHNVFGTTRKRRKRRFWWCMKTLWLQSLYCVSCVSLRTRAFVRKLRKLCCMEKSDDVTWLHVLRYIFRLITPTTSIFTPYETRENTLSVDIKIVYDRHWTCIHTSKVKHVLVCFRFCSQTRSAMFCSTMHYTFLWYFWHGHEWLMFLVRLERQENDLSSDVW